MTFNNAIAPPALAERTFGTALNVIDVHESCKVSNVLLRKKFTTVIA